jgi:anti-sigma factor RsiW
VGLTNREAEMSESPRLISEDELQAYVDNQLDAATRAAVDLYLDQHPDKARRVTAYQRQRAILRAAITDARPRPSKLSAGRIAKRLERQRARWRVAAAAVCDWNRARRDWGLVLSCSDDF